MGNFVCDVSRLCNAMLDALCCFRGGGGNQGNKARSNGCYGCLETCCCWRSPRDNPSDGFRDNYGDVHCAYNDDYTIDTVCIQGQAMILPPNESTIEPFISELGEGATQSGTGNDVRESSTRGSLGGNVIYKQPLNVGLLQYNQNQERAEQYYLDIR